MKNDGTTWNYFYKYEIRTITTITSLYFFHIFFVYLYKHRIFFYRNEIRAITTTTSNQSENMR